MNLPNKIHVIGICGVATSAIAIAFHKRGVIVTGSDKGFFPPVSTELEKQGVPFYAGWHPEKMVEGGVPDFVMIGGSGTSPSNPEVVYAREHDIPVMSYPEVLQKYFIKKNSIVVAGTWGKTTSSAILSFILEKAGMKPSYFTGGLSLSHGTGMISDSDWSVVEGDEYQVSISDKRPKFVYYSPTHLMVTSVSWDHADLYPTEKAYFDEFRKLVCNIPSDGLIISNADQMGVKQVVGEAKAKVVTYGTKDADYVYDSVKPSREGLDFTIHHGESSWHIHSPMLGRFNAENIAGCFAMAKEIGIEPAVIIKAIADFKGIKRRFEKRFEGDYTVLDCHAPTPEKAASVLQSVKEVYSGKIVAVFEPNIGGRQRESIAKYDGTFKDANIVLIPRLTKLKISNDETETALEGDELAKIIGRSHPSVHYIEDDEKFVMFLKEQTGRGDVIVFLGSHGFRGMIEQVISK